MRFSVSVCAFFTPLFGVALIERVGYHAFRRIILDNDFQSMHVKNSAPLQRLVGFAVFVHENRLAVRIPDLLEIVRVFYHVNSRIVAVSIRQAFFFDILQRLRQLYACKAETTVERFAADAFKTIGKRNRFKPAKSKRAEIERLYSLWNIYSFQ